MITDTILDALFGSINALLSLMPAFSLPDPGTNTTALGGILGDIDGVIPVGTIIQIILAAFVLRVAMSTWDFVVFIYHQFWGSE